MFFPYQTSLKNATFPLVTTLFTLLCLLVFFQQQRSHEETTKYADTWCHSHQPRDLLALVGATPYGAGCEAIFSGIHNAWRPASRIAALSALTSPIAGLSETESQNHVRRGLLRAYNQFRINAPANVSTDLAFHPDQPLGPSLLSANFAHVGWLHLLGNLIFFLVFAAAVEKTIGHFAVWILILILAIGGQLAYGIFARQTGGALPSVGLSGVVMGLIAFLAVLRPRTRVHFMTFLLAMWRPSLPVWVLALGYVTWDLFQQTYAVDNGVNYAAHLGGALLGALIAGGYRLLLRADESA